MTISREEIIEDWYLNDYVRLHYNGGKNEAIARRQHEALIAAWQPDLVQEEEIVLELGGGDGQHRDLVTTAFRGQYVSLDLRFPSNRSYNRGRVSEIDRLKFVQGDAHCLPFSDGSVSRVIATCLALHLSDPLRAFYEWLRVVSPRGSCHFVVPCESGVGVALGRRFVSERQCRSLGIPIEKYRLVNALDHRSSFSVVANVAASVARTANRKLTIDWWPFRKVPSHHCNAFAVFTIGEAQ